MSAQIVEIAGFVILSQLERIIIQCECTHREKTVCIELDRERREKGGERAGVLSTMGSITW